MRDKIEIQHLADNLKIDLERSAKKLAKQNLTGEWHPYEKELAIARHMLTGGAQAILDYILDEDWEVNNEGISFFREWLDCVLVEQMIEDTEALDPPKTIPSFVFEEPIQNESYDEKELPF